MKTPVTLRIGQLAEEAGVSVEALRYYERIGLLPRPPRSRGGMRQYGPRELERLRFIRQAQRNGLRLQDIRELLACRDSRDAARCRRVLTLLRKRIAMLDEQLEELSTFRSVLHGYAERCERAHVGRADPDCPIVDELGRRRTP